MLKQVMLAASLLCTIFANAQATDVPSISLTNNVAISRLATQIKKFPEEKVYLHIDKPYYAAGERIWFRAHLVHAAIHVPFLLSRFVYVELLNAENDIVIRKKLKPIDGMYYGQMELAAEIPEGWYSLRAYTNYMRNIDEAYFFRKSVFIGNPLNTEQTSTVIEPAKEHAHKQEKPEHPYTVTLYPEGGHLVAGSMQLVAVRSISGNNTGVAVSGRIFDEEKAEITTFRCTEDGFGVISFIPLAGKRYTAICEDSQGHQLTVTLPPASESDYALNVQQNASILQITLKTPNDVPLQDSVSLIVHQRGLPIFQSAFIPSAPPVISLSKEGLNSGMIQLLALNRNGNILSDRLVFINNPDKIQVTVTTDKPLYRKRDGVHASISLKDAEGNPVQGNFSISITDDADVKINPEDGTIVSQLLLQSEFKEPISHLNRYFLPDNRIAAAQLDLLMLTSQWQRYNVPEILKGNLSKGDLYPLELGDVISGKVQSYPSKRGIPNINVSMMIRTQSYIDAATTDKNGRFYFQGFEFPDSTKIMLQAMKKPGAFMDIVPDKDTFPSSSIFVPSQSSLALEKNMRDFFKKSRERYDIENGSMTINLKEVEVVAKKEDKLKDLRRDRGAYYDNPSYSFSGDDLETAVSLVDLLIRAPGMSMDASGTGVLLRNKTPLLKVDNMTWTMDQLSTINPTDVDLIDILKDPGETAMYGSEGSNGVICIYLKRGGAAKPSTELESNQALLSPLGYCVPATFPMPAYQIPENKLRTIPDLRSTLYWKPNVVCDSTGKADIFFYLADSQGPCTVTIEGVSPKGEIIHYQGKLNAPLRPVYQTTSPRKGTSSKTTGR
ncbi:MAG: hypothetical protein Q8914_02295 [Bacteroidota bacterium]|nr:hypothetical protein [Bacteroidota bacterium]